MKKQAIENLVKIKDVWGLHHFVTREDFQGTKTILSRYNKIGNQIGKKVGKNCWQPSQGIHRRNIVE